MNIVFNSETDALRNRIMLITERQSQRVATSLLASYFQHSDPLIKVMLELRPECTLGHAASELLASLQESKPTENPYNETEVLQFVRRAAELIKPSIHRRINNMLQKECETIARIGREALDWTEKNKVNIDPTEMFRTKIVVERVESIACKLKMTHATVNYESYAEHIMSVSLSIGNSMSGHGLDYETALKFWSDMNPSITDNGTPDARSIQDIYRSETKRLNEIEQRRYGLTEAIGFIRQTDARLHLLEQRLYAIARANESDSAIIYAREETEVVAKYLDELGKSIQKAIENHSNDIVELARVAARYEQALEHFRAM